MTIRIDRRRILSGAAIGLGAAVAGCDRIGSSETGSSWLGAAEQLTYRIQRLLIGAARLAPEFSEADITPNFKSNGTSNPPDKNYQKFASDGFKDWRLRVDGMVETPLDLSLADMRALPSRTQITRHDCVEGWSCIGKWTGAPLAAVLERAQVKPTAKFVVFHCFDTMEGSDAETEGSNAPATLDNRVVRYYESIDLVDAMHPQTILAYDMNGKPLEVPYGAPLRLRVERQLGYKMAKYLKRIELVDSFANLGDGKGGYWEDRGYQWYAGI